MKESKKHHQSMSVIRARLWENVYSHTVYGNAHARGMKAQLPEDPTTAADSALVKFDTRFKAKEQKPPVTVEPNKI